jgi:hypothetical protein
MLPWGDVSSVEEGAMQYIPSFLAPSNPVLTIPASFLANEDLFTDQELVADVDGGGEHVTKVLLHLWNEVAPAALNLKRLDKIWGSIYGDKTKYGVGAKTTIGEAMVDYLFGIKLRNVDYLEQAFYRSQELQRKAVDIRMKYSRQLDDIYLRQSGRYSEQALERATTKIQERMLRDMEELQEEALYRFMQDSEDL